MTYALPYHENVHQLRVNNFGSYISGCQGIVGIYEFIPELLTTFLGNNITYERTTIDSKIIDIAHWKTCKKRLLAAQYMILTRYYHQIPKTRAMYESTDEPTARRADNPSHADWLRDFH